MTALYFTVLVALALLIGLQNDDGNSVVERIFLKVGTTVVIFNIGFALFALLSWVG